MRHEVPHIPGGMNSDVVETELGQIWYEEVVNLRQKKKGEWINCPGYKSILNVPSGNVKAAIEINDDLSGDRFLLIQRGTVLTRVDYDISNSPEFGYENESAATSLTLPTGYTIPSNATLRFFVHSGVVRITGTSPGPLWYGYIERNLFDNKWSEYYPITDNMVGHPNWNGTSADIAKSSVQYHGTLDTVSSRITQTGADGYAYRSFQVVVGESYSVSVWVYKATTGSDGDPILKVGRTKDGTEYGTATTATKDAWVELTVSFTAATNGRLYVSINAGNGASDDVLYIDDFELDITSDGLTNVIELADWYLLPAEIGADDDLVELVDIGALDDAQAPVKYVFAKYFLIYDNQQYSLPRPLTMDAALQASFVLNPINEFHVARRNLGSLYFRLKISESFNQRITGIGILIHTTEEPIYNEDEAVWRVAQVIYLDEALDPVQYEQADCDYDNANPNDLELWNITLGTEGTVQDGFWMADTDCEITRTISVGVEGSMRTVCTDVDYSSTSQGIITLLDTIFPPLLSADVDTTMNDVVMKIFRRWIFDTDSYYVNFGFDVSLGIEYPDFTGIPSTIEDNNPDYTHHVVIEGIAYVNTQEDGEEDQIRYSPLNQLDNFPVTNIFPTDFGTLDTIKALVKRDDRLVILKGDLIGQGNFVGGRFFHDTESPGDGLFSDYGYIVIGTTLFYIDKDDVYQFVGVRPSPLLVHQRVKNRFLERRGNNPFILENKLDNEIWIYLSKIDGTKPNGEFLVFNPAMNEWYIRSVDYTPIGGFIDADRKMCVYSEDDILTYDHGAAAFDETTTWQFTTKLHTERFARNLKKLHEINIYGVNLSNAECIFTDEEDNTSQTNEVDITNLVGGDPVPTTGYAFPKFFYKQLSITIRNKTAAQNTQAILRKIILKVDNWR